MANKIDLHTHTTASDGTLTPTELVAHARELGLSAVAITDHDTMNGVAEAQTAGERLGVEVIPGMEISTDYRGEDTHVLGYGMDINAPALREVLDWVIEDRRRRNERIAERMRRDGIDVSLEELEAQFSYLGKSFRHKVSRCPMCGQICLSEELVTGRMSEVESMMEDK